MSEQTTVERAFALARTGQCRSVNELRQRLRREGYDSVHLHLHGASINRQLVVLINAAAKDIAEGRVPEGAAAETAPE